MSLAIVPSYNMPQEAQDISQVTLASGKLQEGINKDLNLFGFYLEFIPLYIDDLFTNINVDVSIP